MILEVNRGSIKVSINGKTAQAPGEIFFPPDGKMGFAIDLKNLKHWDFPNHNLDLTKKEIGEIIDKIRSDFSKGGHSLAIE
jgi:hypothetical protein